MHNKQHYDGINTALEETESILNKKEPTVKDRI
jgi:hypothetical protein